MPPTSRRSTRPSQYKEVGRSTSTPTAQTERKEVKILLPYVVVGFEVNNPNGHAFDNLVQNLDMGSGGDYGHAFFYLVEDGKIVRLFSFGPNGEMGKVGWLGLGNKHPASRTGAVVKDGFKDERPSTANYQISEATRLFRVDVTKEQVDKLKAETDELVKDIKKGYEPYTVWRNDTCAETARDLLLKADIKTPEGAGKIKAPTLGEIWFTMVNPYMWHHNFKKAGYQEVVQKPMEEDWKKAQAAQIPDPVLTKWTKKP